MRKKSNEQNFKLKLPDDEDSEGNHWIDSLNDSRVTVKEDMGDSEEEEASDMVMKVKEYANRVSDKDIKTAIDMIRNAKETDNNALGLISNSTNFTFAKMETFLFDSSA